MIHYLLFILYLFYFLISLFNWKLIALHYCTGFCHTLTWISHGCTCVPHPESPSHLPPYPIPLGHPSAPALSTLYHASNLDCRSISHMIIYIFQCYSLKSSHNCSHHLQWFWSPQNKTLAISFLLVQATEIFVYLNIYTHWCLHAVFVIIYQW